MDIKNLLTKVGIIIVILFIMVFVGLGIIFYDVASFTATDSEILQPSGNPLGDALVVYDPGLSGKSKNVAEVIAKELRSKGYKVDLVGIKSPKATQIDNYDIIIVGGPVYAGMVAKSVQNYLKALNPRSNTKLGVFTTGNDPETANNKELLLKEAAPLPENSNLEIHAVIKIVNENNDKINDFLNDLLI
ncbi:MAG: hypothetical protein Kow0019_07630 [Methanobacteriaceae archaeon]